VSRNLDEALSLIEVSDKEKINSIIRREEEIDIEVKEARNKHLKDFITVFAVPRPD